MNDPLSGVVGERCIYLDQEIWQRLEAQTSKQDFCAAWLELQCALFSQLQCGVVILQDGEGFAPSASWPEHFKPTSQLADASERALERRRGVVLKPESNHAGETAIAYPVMVGGELFGAVALQVSPCSDDALQLVLRMVQWGIVWIENYFLQQQTGHDYSPPEHVEQTLDIFALTLEQHQLDDAAQVLLNEMATRMNCDKVSLAFLRKGRARIFAMSHNAKFDKKMNLFHCLESTMDEAYLQKETIAFPGTENGRLIMRNHAAYSEQYGAKYLLTLLLQDGDKTIGMITLERTEGSLFSAPEICFAETIACLAGPVMQARKQLARHLFFKAVDAGKGQLAKIFGPNYLTRKVILLLLSMLILFFSLAEADFRVSADAEVEGSVRRTVSTPFDGYIAKAFFRAGDRVKQGDVLCRMDKRDIDLERNKWVGKLNQFTDQYHDAMAKHEKAKIQIYKAKIAQAQAQVDLSGQQLQRAEIVAPFDGLVVSGDLTQSLGSARHKGDVLFEITPLNSYRVILQVAEQDITRIHNKQSGSLRLTSLPRQAFKLYVEKITPVNTAKDGGNFFRVEAALEGTPHGLRPGMKGIAKVNIEPRKLVWIWTHEWVDWLRLWIWSWWP